jgi:hypothetical protein
MERQAGCGLPRIGRKHGRMRRANASARCVRPKEEGSVAPVVGRYARGSWPTCSKSREACGLRCVASSSPQLSAASRGQPDVERKPLGGGLQALSADVSPVSIGVTSC